MKYPSDGLTELFSSGCRAQFVRWVASARPADFTVGTAARHLGRKRTSLVPEVHRLVRLGLLSARTVGSQNVYSSNPGPRLEALTAIVREFESDQLALFGPTDAG